MQRTRKVKFLSKKTIVSLIGIDYSILKEAGEEKIHKFYICGLLVILILILSFFSVFYAFELMFHMWYAEIFLASFFALMFFTIYVLLIQTFSKEVLPKTRFEPFFNLSNVGRMAFVFMIGFIISQPLKILILEDRLEPRLKDYKNEVLSEFSRNLTLLYQDDILAMQSQKNREIPIYGAGHPSILKIDERISLIHNKINQEEADVRAKITGSDFFVRRIVLCNGYLEGWLITVIIVSIFAVPVFLIYSISSNSRYYQIKKNKEFHLVNNHYQRFKIKYSEIFNSKFAISGVSFYETFADAPFNTVRKDAPATFSQEDFKTKFLN